MGVDYLSENNTTFGAMLSASKWLNQPKIQILGKTSIFESHVDYQLGISRMFFFDNKFVIRSSAVGLYYESFKGFNDLNLSLTMWF